MNILPFNRDAAVAYAQDWALRRNPAYGDFSDMGGDCSNFISQALIAGGAVMNTARDTGWYYRSMNDRAAGWSGVPFLYKFLTGNRGRGPFGHEIPVEEAEPGDIIQLRFAGKDDYSHSLLVTETRGGPRVAAHSYDSLGRPLSAYSYDSARALRIDGVRV